MKLSGEAHGVNSFACAVAVENYDRSGDIL